LRFCEGTEAIDGAAVEGMSDCDRKLELGWGVVGGSRELWAVPTGDLKLSDISCQGSVGTPGWGPRERQIRGKKKITYRKTLYDTIKNVRSDSRSLKDSDGSASKTLEAASIL
jgi:hypothetical protein